MPFFFSSRRRHTRSYGDWSSDVCSSDLETILTTYNLARRGGEVVGGEDGLREPDHLEGVVCAAPEIGRASCRERVSIAVGDVSLEHKAEAVHAHGLADDARRIRRYSTGM